MPLKNYLELKSRRLKKNNNNNNNQNKKKLNYLN